MKTPKPYEKIDFDEAIQEYTANHFPGHTVSYIMRAFLPAEALDMLRDEGYDDEYFDCTFIALLDPDVAFLDRMKQQFKHRIAILTYQAKADSSNEARRNDNACNEKD